MRTLVLVVSLFLALGAMPAGASALTVAELVERAREYDGKQVTIQGEVIGDVMIRGPYGWINLADGTGEIGVWATADALEKIRLAGRYHWSGDQVRVTGEFRRADPDHGGDLLLRASSLEVLAGGTPSAHPVEAASLILAAGALGLAGVMGFVRLRVRGKE